MVTREHYRLRDRKLVRAGTVFDLRLALLYEHEVTYDVEEAVAVEHILPEVTGPVTAPMRWVAGAAADTSGVAAPVEGQERRVAPGEARCHVDFVRVYGEMHEGATLE